MRILPRRGFPGFTNKRDDGQPLFIRGVVIYASPRVQAIETESKVHPLIHLMGDAYLFLCETCRRNVLQNHVPFSMDGIPRCPDCGNQLEALKRGDKVRVHFRFDPGGDWGNWYGERFEW